MKEEIGQAKASKRGGKITEADYDDRADVDQYHRRIEQLEADLKRRQVECFGGSASEKLTGGVGNRKVTFEGNEHIRHEWRS